jgi:hypothetical protein
LLLKWKLMLTTLPFVAVVTALKLILDYGVKFAGVVDFGDVGVVLTGAVFLTGFLLAGTMADYKESEKLPGEVATNLEMLEELFIFAANSRPAVNGKALLQEVLTLTDAIKNWLVKKQTTPQIFAALTQMNLVILKLDKDGANADAGKALPHLNALRKSVSRIDVISRTGFLPPAYALLEVLIVMIISLMMIARFRSVVAEMLLVPFVALVNIYMLRLIKDVDNPFDFKDGVRDYRSGEVALFPLDEYRERLAARD